MNTDSEKYEDDLCQHAIQIISDEFFVDPSGTVCYLSDFPETNIVESLFDIRQFNKDVDI